MKTMLCLITGSAGTGKTTKLIEETTAWIQTHPLQGHQEALFLSRMHGSRRRLVERLKENGTNFAYDVSTVDALVSCPRDIFTKSFDLLQD
jgi:hypothetical protein